VKFTSLTPPKIRVTGRIKHFTSAFGEHVIAEEAEAVMIEAIQQFSLRVNEFHLAPQVNPKDGGLPHHEWIVEWDERPQNIEAVAEFIHFALAKKNVYYKDLIQDKVIRTAVITSVDRGAFNNYMRKEGKLGGQNKIPRLANDRKIADGILA
jgi:hypothetical protein